MESVSSLVIFTRVGTSSWKSRVHLCSRYGDIQSHVWHVKGRG